MSVEQTLIQRCDSQCELCTSGDNLGVVSVPPSDDSAEQSIMACESCRAQLDGSAELNPNHWRCLNDSMWSQVPAVQVMAWRQLTHLSTAGETWAQELLDMLYLDDEAKAWAEAGIEQPEEDDSDPTLDVNGVRLTAGDTVVLIKDLPVKGTSMVAKRGTAVRGISLTSNPEHIEGRVNGQRIVIISAYTKKS